MNAYSSVAILLLAAGALLVLPLLPSLIELRRKSDALPLNVIPQHAGEIRYFADSFRTYINALQPALQECLRDGTTASGFMPDGARYLVLGWGDEPPTLPLETGHLCELVLASSSDLRLPANTTFSRDIYVDGRIIGGVHNSYRAVLGEKDVYLGSSSRVLRWVHSGNEFLADPECQLFGRVSSDRSIRLHRDSIFRRLNAPRIETGPATAESAASSVLYGTTNLAAQRVLHDGDLTISAGGVFHGNLVVRGILRIGRDAHVAGSVKCEKDVFLEPGVQISGSLVSQSTMYIGAGCALRGPIIAERGLVIAHGTCCGTAEAPTTVSASDIEIEEGVLVYGTLWAREQGRVVVRV